MASSTRRHRALFVDLDGTVRDTKTGRPHPVKSWDQVVRPGVAERLREYKQRRYKLVAVTNQGGVAFGYLTELDLESIHRHLLEELLPDTFDLLLYCPYHPRARIPQYKQDHEDRKPRPGMAFKARDALGLDLSKSIMVGDLDSDREFATNAGLGAFFWADEFFGPNARADAAVPDAPRRRPPAKRKAKPVSRGKTARRVRAAVRAAKTKTKSKASKRRPLRRGSPARGGKRAARALKRKASRPRGRR